MPVAVDTYAPDLPHAYLLRQGATQTIQIPIRYGPEGPLVSPVQAGSSITIERPDGTELVSGAAVVVTSSTATYEVAPSASETLGEGWVITWSLLMPDGVTHDFRHEGMLCEYLPYPVVSADMLFKLEPELRYRVPQEQGEDGDDVGWQPQIDFAWHEIQEWLIEKGRRPWLIVEAVNLKLVHLKTALRICCRAIASTADDPATWEGKATVYYREAELAKGAFTVRYSDQEAGIRRGGDPGADLRPVGRPAW